MGARPVRQRVVVSERAFKRIAFWSTVGGLVVMATGLRFLLVERAFAPFLLLFVAGGAVASLAILFEPRPEPGFVVELMSREGCTLCEEARAWLSAKAPEYDYALWVTDVDADPALAERYGDHVPVAILHRGEGRARSSRELFRLRADYPLIEREIRRAADARVRGR